MFLRMSNMSIVFTSFTPLSPFSNSPMLPDSQLYDFLIELLYIIIKLYIKPDRSIMCGLYVYLFRAGHLGLDLLPQQLEALHLGGAPCEISSPMLECQTVLSFYRFCLGRHSFEISWMQPFCHMLGDTILQETFWFFCPPFCNVPRALTQGLCCKCLFKSSWCFFCWVSDINAVSRCVILCSSCTDSHFLSEWVRSPSSNVCWYLWYLW